MVRTTRIGERAVALVVAALVLTTSSMIASPRESSAQPDRWVLDEVIVSPSTEFVVGETPGFFESPRYDGTFERYEISATSMVHRSRRVDQGEQRWDMTTEVVMTGPPPVLVVGDEMTVAARATASGSAAGAWNPFDLFEFRAEGVGLIGERSAAVGLNPDYYSRTAAVSPTFTVPAPGGDDPEFRIAGVLWNCASCSVQWVYRPDSGSAGPTPIPPTPTTVPAPTATTIPTPTPTPEPDDVVPCVVQGRVVDAGARPEGPADRGGHPLIGVSITLRDVGDFGAPLLTTATDRNGEYRFVITDEVATTWMLDLGTEPVEVELRLREAAHDPPRFEVVFDRRRTALASDGIVLGRECADGGLVIRDFDLADIPDAYEARRPTDVELWDDIGEIYDRIHRATQLADLLGQPLDYGRPLIVCAYCTDAVFGRSRVEPDAAFWCGDLSDGRSCGDFPVIAFGDATSSLSDPEWPDNREYHEWGHHFLADAFGNAFPAKTRGDVNHGGYYRNRSTTDSWSEGFAEFFSMMVSKHIDGEAMPHLYRVSGGYLDLEADYRPWQFRGQAEELAVAGLLLDLVDGPDDYRGGRTRPDLRVAWHDVYEDPALGSVMVGEVENRSVDDVDLSEQTMVAAELRSDGTLVHTGWAITRPWDIPGMGGRGFFALVIPAGMVWDEVTLAAFEGRPGSRGTDDDLITIELAELWQAIVGHTSVQPAANGYVFDVVDLYDAVSSAFGGVDADGNGIDDIDQLFIAHGLFADRDGDRSHRRGEDPGWTDRLGRFGFADELPRRGAVVPMGTRWTIDADGLETEVVVVVQTVGGSSGDVATSYIAEPDSDGRVHVAVPPGEGTVWVAAVAAGHAPAVLATVDAEEFLVDVDALGEDAALELVARLEPLTPEEGSMPWRWLLLGGGALLVVTAAALATWSSTSRRF